MTISKTQAFSLLEGLTEKSLTFGCLVKDYASGKTMRYAGRHFSDVRMKDFCAYYSLWNGEQELFGQLNDDFTYPENRIIGHPVLIGDVLHRCYEEKVLRDETLVELLDTWADCGIKLSLQSILEGATWEEKSKLCTTNLGGDTVETYQTVEVLKDEKVEALVSFLISLHLVK